MKQVQCNSKILAVLLFLSMLAAVGSSSGCNGGNAAPPPPPPAIAVGIIPSGAQSVDQGQSIKFTANVTNDSSNKGVTWALTQNGTACSPGCGTIAPASTPSGQPATYTAPAAVNANLQFIVTATSISDTTKFQTDSTTAVPPPVLNNPANLPAATVGQAYSYQLTESGGVSPFAWSITSGSLPAGLTLNQSSGLISGTPTSATAAVRGTARSMSAASSGVQICFNVQVVDSGNPPIVNSQQVCINVAAATGAPSQLAFIQQPTNVGALTSIAPAVTVAIEDASGNLVATDHGYVTIAIGTNPNNGTLTGATTQAAVGGIAAFPNLQINMPGKGYTLVASAPGLTSATSNLFDVTVAVTVAPEKNCGTLGVPLNGTCLFVATALGDNGIGVTWSLNDPAGCPGATCGTVLPLGRVNLAAGDIDVYRYAMLYFGPDNSLSFPSTVTVKATSVLDPMQSGSAMVSLTQLAPSIGIVAPLISANYAGTTGGTGSSSKPVINQDGGFVAYLSTAPDLNNVLVTTQQDVFLKPTCIGLSSFIGCVPLGSSVVSVDNSGREGSGPSDVPSISSDGQVVGFVGPIGLDPSFPNAGGAYAADECSPGHCIVPPPHLISVDSLGSPIGGGQPFISPDGRWLPFGGGIATLGGTTYLGGLYLGDACTGVAVPPCKFGAVSFLSVNENGDPSSGSVLAVAASQITGQNAGGFVAFASDATDLVPGATSGKSEIYVRDLGLGQTFLISQDNNGNPAPYAFTPSVSYDGRFVSFFSTGLVPNDTNGALHLYVRDTCFNVTNCSPTTTLADVATLGANVGKSSLTGVEVSANAISSTGRFVAFTSGSPDLAPIPQTYAHAFDNTGIYVRDMSCTSLSVCPDGGIHLVSLTGGGEFLGAAGGIDMVAISGDGHYVVYTLLGGQYQQAVLALTGF